MSAYLATLLGLQPNAFLLVGATIVLIDGVQTFYYAVLLELTIMCLR